MKSYTDLKQSKKLSEILPIESAAMYYLYNMPYAIPYKNRIDVAKPCWSLATLLKCLSEIKPQVYTTILFPSEDKWILQFVEYGHGNVCGVL